MENNTSTNHENGNDANRLLAVVYCLSNNREEKIVKLPKNATNIAGDGIYLIYDLPIGIFGSMTHSVHLGYEGANVIFLRVAQKRYTCNLCGRNRFDKLSPHKCKGGFRKRNIQWSINYR